MGYSTKNYQTTRGLTGQDQTELVKVLGTGNAQKDMEAWNNANPGKQLIAGEYSIPNKNAIGFGFGSRKSRYIHPAIWRPMQAAVTSSPGSATSSNGGTASSLLNSLLGQADPSRSMIDTAAVGAKSAADTAYGGMIRNLSRMGVNPNAPRFAATMKDWAAQRAAMEAGARNAAARAGSESAFGRRFNLFQAMKSSDEADKARAFTAEQNRIGREAENARFAYQQQMDAQARRDAAGREDKMAKAQLAEMKGYSDALAAAGKGASSSKPSSVIQEALSAARTPTVAPTVSTAPKIYQQATPAQRASNAANLNSLINQLGGPRNSAAR